MNHRTTCVTCRVLIDSGYSRWSIYLRLSFLSCRWLNVCIGLIWGGLTCVYVSVWVILTWCLIWGGFSWTYEWVLGWHEVVRWVDVGTVSWIWFITDLTGSGFSFWFSVDFYFCQYRGQSDKFSSRKSDRGHPHYNVRVFLSTLSLTLGTTPEVGHPCVHCVFTTVSCVCTTVS